MIDYPFVVCGGCGKTLQEGRHPVTYQLCDDCQSDVLAKIVAPDSAKYVVVVSILGVEHRVGFNDVATAGLFKQWAASRGYEATTSE